LFDIFNITPLKVDIERFQKDQVGACELTFEKRFCSWENKNCTLLAQKRMRMVKVL
jgi:hypothetical protein